MSQQTYKTLRLVLGDQLNAQHSWFRQKDPEVLYVVAELHQEMRYVHHHVQKVCAFLTAMAGFADALSKAGHQVLYLTLDETAAHKKLTDLLQHLVRKFAVQHFEYQIPDEYRLLRQMRDLRMENVAIHEWESEHFFLRYAELPQYFVEGKAQRMEMFYRLLRQRFHILMEGDQPASGRWNYDEDNRQKLHASDLENIPKPLVFKNDVTDILVRLEKHKVKTFGQESKNLVWPVNRAQALRLLKHFCEHCLPNFGRFQDAMTAQHQYAWSLYHARLSFAINSKMLSPKIVVNEALKSYEENSQINLAQVEGFIRQILGWREFVRGIYWLNMPAYAGKNHLSAKQELPPYFWTGDTQMACMKACLGQSLQYAYAHHIQRLMVIGNFCLIAGISPDQVDAWYLGVYVDAIQWVEMPNTRGMSQFADGGLIASKPYAASGNYIHKMSDYCGDCRYRVKEKTGSDACPFNSLYWHFMHRHRQKFERNPRISVLYKNWDKQPQIEKDAVLQRAEWCLNNLADL